MNFNNLRPDKIVLEDGLELYETDLSSGIFERDFSIPYQKLPITYQDLTLPDGNSKWITYPVDTQTQIDSPSLDIDEIPIEISLPKIPNWVKNTMQWYLEGVISEGEMILAIQYLVNQGILQIPIKIATATMSNLSSDDIAESFVVTFQNGNFAQDITIYTYSQFFHYSETITTNGFTGFQETPGFILRSLPSKDKAPIYDVVNDYMNSGEKPPMFNVNVKILSGDGSMIQTWDYRRCTVIDYSTYVDDDKDEYRFGNEDKAEIRDALVIECNGFSLKTS